MADTFGFMGMRDSLNYDQVTGWRPKNWRETMLFLYPNGMMPLTAMMSKLRSESTDDPEYNWFQKLLPRQAADVTLVSRFVGGAPPYGAGAVAGDTLYLFMAANQIDHFRTQHVVIMRDSSDPSVDVIGRVSGRNVAGALSYISVILLENDDNSATHDLSNCDRVIIIGTANAEGAGVPIAVSYDPTRHYNFTQIFRNSLDMTNTAKQTRLRTGSQYKEAKREALELHGIEMEKAFIFGEMSLTYDPGTGDPNRTTRGLVRHLSTNVFNFQTAHPYMSWLTAGEAWMDDCLEQLFRYGKTEKFMMVGSGFLKGINQLAKNSGYFMYTAKTKAFGIQVLEWVTPYGTVYMKTHPLFNYEETWRHMAIAVEPEKIRYRYLAKEESRDTKFLKDRQDRGADRTTDEFLTEAGPEVHHELCHGVFYGGGLNGPRVGQSSSSSISSSSSSSSSRSSSSSSASTP